MGIKNGMTPVHPGEILRDEIEAAGVSEGELSRALDVPLNRVTMILEGRQGISADTSNSHFGVRLDCQTHNNPPFRIDPGKIDRRTPPVERADGHSENCCADTALRLARYFGTTPELWLDLQKSWELRRAEIEVGRQIDKRVTPRPAA